MPKLFRQGWCGSSWHRRRLVHGGSPCWPHAPAAPASLASTLPRWRLSWRARGAPAACWSRSSGSRRAGHWGVCCAGTGVVGCWRSRCQSVGRPHLVGSFLLRFSHTNVPCGTVTPFLYRQARGHHPHQQARVGACEVPGARSRQRGHPMRGALKGRNGPAATVAPAEPKGCRCYC